MLPGLTPGARMRRSYGANTFCRVTLSDLTSNCAAEERIEIVAAMRGRSDFDELFCIG